MRPTTLQAAIRLVEEATEGSVRLEAERVLLLDRDGCVALAVFRTRHGVVSNVLRLGIDWAREVLLATTPEASA